jgi:hypothetical protein
MEKWRNRRTVGKLNPETHTQYSEQQFSYSGRFVFEVGSLLIEFELTGDLGV